MPHTQPRFGEPADGAKFGMKWNTESDCLCFSVRLGQPVLTKRGVLSRVSSEFDPLEVLSLYLFLAKSLIQTLWRKRKHWDEPLDLEDLAVWEKWSADLSSLQEFQLPRWTSIDKFLATTIICSLSALNR